MKAVLVGLGNFCSGWYKRLKRHAVVRLFEVAKPGACCSRFVENGQNCYRGRSAERGVTICCIWMI